MDLAMQTCKYCGNLTPEKGVFCMVCGARLARKKREKGRELVIPKPRRLASGEWSGRVMVNGNRETVRGATETEYYDRARALKAGVLESKKGVDRRPVRECVAAYIREREGLRSPATIDGYLRKAKSNLQGVMDKRVDELTKEIMQAAITADAAAGYSGKTIKEALALISSATGRRFDGLALPSTRPKKKPPVYSEDELRRLLLALADIGGEVEAAGLLAVWLSLRRSEIMGLKWADVGKDTITVRAAMVYDKDHKLVEKETKTEQSERPIRCSQYVLDKLAALPGKHKPEEHVITASTAALWEGITAACEKAGIPHGYLHGLRHVNASVMELVGVPDVYANKRGGWSADHVRRGTYVDTMDEGERAAAEKVDSYLEGLINRRQ